MKTSRLIVAGVAGLATIGAYFLSSPSKPPPAPIIVQQQQQAAPAQTVDVLVTAVDIQMGSILKAPDLKWSKFPPDGVNPQFISLQPGESPETKMKDVEDTIARYPFVANEPVRLEKLIRSNGSGFLSAILPSGKRAVAITTETTGASTAGGFILPNDYVDVIRVYRDPDPKKTGDAMKSEIVVNNVRVLAIGQNIQERGGEKFITSQTATLELDPRQTQLVVLAQKSGSLSLALRSIQDANRPEPTIEATETKGLTMIRFGVANEAVRK